MSTLLRPIVGVKLGIAKILHLRVKCYTLYGIDTFIPQCPCSDGRVIVARRAIVLGRGVITSTLSSGTPSDRVSLLVEAAAIMGVSLPQNSTTRHLGYDTPMV